MFLLCAGIACDPDTVAPLDTDVAPADPEPDVIPPAPALWSHAHGVVDQPFELVLGEPFRDAEIRYTLDGRDPTTDGVPYTAPIPVGTTTVVRVVVLVDGEVVLPTQTRTFLFLGDVASQSAPDDWPTRWWTDFEGGPYAADYEVDPEITEHPDYADLFPAVFQDVPIVSVVLPPEDLFGEAGIHEHPTDEGVDWERAASLEIFDAQGVLDETIDCGLRIQGGAGRRPDRSPKKSFRLAFRGRYGAGQLTADLFPDADYDEFDTLVLRAGYNRSWVHWLPIQRNRAQYLRERYVADLVRDIGHPASHVRLSHLFLNGVYWGVYQLEERPDAAWMAGHWGGVEGDYDSINSGVVSEGDDVAWNALFTTARAGLESDEAFAELEAVLDVDAFIDYMLIQISLGNVDWPHKNYWAGRKRETGGRWTFFVWDSELTMPATRDSFVHVDAVGSPGEIFQLARANPEFVVRFGDAVHRELFNDGRLTSAALIERWDALSPMAYPTIIAESARWGDHMRDVRGAEDAELYTYNDHWLVENDRAREQFFAVRPEWVVEDYRLNGLYPTVDAPSISPFGGDVDPGSEIELSAAQGTVYLTVDGSDPRVAGGEISPEAVAVDGRALLVTADAVVSSRVLHDGVWSALARAHFVVR